MSYNLPSYILQELPDITESINYPLRNSHRIKYTCFDVSKSLIAFGATSGGIYIFNRAPCEFVQLVPNKDGAITRLLISPDENHIAFANGRGTVTATECDQSISSSQSSVNSKEHHGHEVTAMVWSRNMLFTGDDVGKISVLQLQSFIAKTIFQNSSETIMNLDSRICQLDIKDHLLLVSTYTRCYICDTSQEQYRQIGQKLRDGEFGACFVSKQTLVESENSQNTTQDFTELRKYNIVDDAVKFSLGDKFINTLIYCARPSSRLWEATVDGTVRRTHQFKQVLAKPSMKVMSLESYNNENIGFADFTNVSEEKSINFAKIFYFNDIIFSFTKDALYFLNVQDVDNTMWFDTYKDIIECKFYHDTLYVWLADGSLVNLKYMKIDKFLLKCYVDEKYVLCAELCALFKDYLLSNNLSTKLHILVSLKDKLANDILKTIDDVLAKFDSLKSKEATQTKSGIYVVDNTYQTQASLSEDNESPENNDHNKFAARTPESLQTLKDLSMTVSDKLSSSKKLLKEKWEDFEGKIKHLGNEKQYVTQDTNTPVILGSEDHIVNDDIIYKESSQKNVNVDNNSLEEEQVCRSLYQYFRLSLVNKETKESNLISLIENYACDINEIYRLMLLLEQFCISIGVSEKSKIVPNNIFLSYLNASLRRDELLESIIKDEILYKYFVDSCITVNMETQTVSNVGCECGFPLPYNKTNQKSVYSELIDEFIEKQWTSQTRNQCYDICKKMPYLWRKILHLRRNEDLLNILRILLQMLDENLLHSFLPQFTSEIWDRTIQLYAILHANMCLNCNKKFEHMSVKDTLNWDDLGALIIKSVGGKNAIKVMKKHADLINEGEISLKFYHTCLLVAMYEKHDVTITGQLTDALYSSYTFEDSRIEIYRLLRKFSKEHIKNTALPIIVAAKSTHWGLSLLNKKNEDGELLEKEEYSQEIEQITLSDIVDNLSAITNGISDCMLCGLPLQNQILIIDGGLWVFRCGHIFHGSCLDLNKVKLCPSCSPKVQ